MKLIKTYKLILDNRKTSFILKAVIHIINLKKKSTTFPK